MTTFGRGSALRSADGGGHGPSRGDVTATRLSNGPRRSIRNRMRVPIRLPRLSHTACAAATPRLPARGSDCPRHRPLLAGRSHQARPPQQPAAATAPTRKKKKKKDKKPNRVRTAAPLRPVVNTRLIRAAGARLTGSRPPLPAPPIQYEPHPAGRRQPARAAHGRANPARGRF